MNMKWTCWENFKRLPGTKHPGVYLIAKFKGKIPSFVQYNDPAIVYIGISAKHTVVNRLSQFGHTFFSGTPGHDGAKRLAKMVKKAIYSARYPKWLYFTIVPVKGRRLVDEMRIQYLERRFIWLYVKRNGRLPMCNKK